MKKTKNMVLEAMEEKGEKVKRQSLFTWGRRSSKTES